MTSINLSELPSIEIALTAESFEQLKSLMQTLGLSRRGTISLAIRYYILNPSQHNSEFAPTNPVFFDIEEQIEADTGLTVRKAGLSEAPEAYAQYALKGIKLLHERLILPLA